MNSEIKFLLFLFIVSMTLLGLLGCNDNKERFEDPPWLGGSNIETLEESGNYTIFLELMERANYTEAITKQLFTLFVPDDEAFRCYFASRGISSVDDLSNDEAVELFTLHVLRNPRSKYQLIYEYVWSEQQNPDGEYGALFFRKPTASTSMPYREAPRYVKGFPDSVWVYTDVKYMPLFSTEYFEDFFGDPNGSDYLFLYPGNQWTGLAWGPAYITDAEVRTSNGFIYFVDKVVPPQLNIEQYLRANQNKYGIYYDMLQRFATYNTQKVSKDRRVMYQKAYNTVSNIAQEKGGLPLGADVVIEKDMYTLFIPRDEILQDYLNRTVLRYYPSIDSVPEITQYYILQTQISSSLGLISKIENSFFNAFGDPMTVSRNDIVSKTMCSNGVVYETNKVYEPDVFTCVPGRLFFDKNYSTFLYAITHSNLLATLTNLEQEVTLFAPNNEEVESYGFRYNEDLEKIEQQGSDGLWKDVRNEDLVLFVQDHIHVGNVSNLSGDGFLEMSSKNYVHYNNNRVSAGENEMLNETVDVLEKVESGRNGVLYTVQKPIKSNLKMGDYIYNEPDFSDFANLLVQAQLLDPNYVDPNTQDTIPNLRFLGESYYWTAFIPSNAAMASAQSAGLIPDIANVDSLKSFLQYHFVRKSTIFDDGEKSGEFTTNRAEGTNANGIIYSTLSINNTPGKLIITDHSGNVTQVNHSDANALVRYGVVHKISTVLKY